MTTPATPSRAQSRAQSQLRTAVAAGIVACSVIAVGAVHNADATLTATWNVDSYTNFDKGEANDSFISSLGEVRPGWANNSVELDFNTAWSAAQSGDTTYIGSDEDAAIYKVRGGKVTKLANIGDPGAVVAVVSLVEASGTLYAGTMPDGEVWSINAKNGKTKKLATLKDTETVWSLTIAGGSLYAGTGPSGLLYKINKSTGAQKQVFDSDDKRIMSLLATGDNAVWMGTSDQALVFRYDIKTGKTRAMADFAGNEVSALVEWQGTVIAAANDFTPGTTTGFKSKESVDKAASEKDKGQEAKLPSTGSKPGADKKASSSVEPQAKSLRKGKGALYRIRGDGQLTQLHALTSSYFTSLAVNSKGQVFAGAADKGRIYMVAPDDSVSTAIDIEQRFIAQVMIDSKDRVSFTTGDSASFYRSSGKATSSSYNSEVFDTDAPSRFGRLAWHSSGAVTLETRSGNTEEPGVGWSLWQGLGSVVSGVGDASRGKVKSPPGRYFQYRVKFGTDGAAVVRATKLFYLPSNRPSKLTKVTVSPKQDAAALSAKTSKPRSPILKLEWDLDNADKDKTSFDLLVRREGEVSWRSIRTGSEPLTKKEFSWNTETFPDGYYRLRVVASDRLANTKSRALEDVWNTPIFVVDNQRPKLSGVSIRYPVVTLKGSDALSTIAGVSFAVDDGQWQLGASQDSIFDDSTELLTLDLPGNLRPGAHTLAIRVSDSAGNIGTSSASFRVK